jgi:thiamine pyrophosphate-dependent acetolactate synthase large subunit-like protein
MTGSTGGTAAEWGSDLIAEAVRNTKIPFIALTPGASFRGFHDSLVNHLGNVRPEMLLCLHEEHAVSIAHGYAKVAGQPMAVALHSNVGLMHATMAIFNAYCDRVPMLILGADGPADAAKRRPWIDWLHTSADLGALVRHYVKWDDRPLSAAAAVMSIQRGDQLTRSAPQAPVFVCFDVASQEEPAPTPAPAPIRSAPLPDPAPDPAVVAEAAGVLLRAERPVILMGRVGRSQAGWDRRVALAEACNARVITHHKLGASFPTDHPLHSGAPALYLTAENEELLRGADVILSLDWLDLGGTLAKAFGNGRVVPTVISASLEHQLFDGWNKVDFTLPSVDLPLACPPDRAVLALRERMEQGAPGPQRPTAAFQAPGVRDHLVRDQLKESVPESGPLTVRLVQESLGHATAGDAVSLLRVPFAWNFAHWPLTGPLDYLGGDGGGGIGAGPGMSVGAALALKESGRLPVAVLGDGDFLMGATALWTASRYDIPLLIIVANNSSFYNDEIHQMKMAANRGRPAANAHIGLRIEGPDADLAGIAQAQGWEGIGPVQDRPGLASALAQALKTVRDGGRALVDVRVERGYGDKGHNITPG